MANPTIRFKRGTQSAFGSVGLQTGEPAFITDELNFYIGIDGNSANNKFFGSHRYWSKESGSKGSGINLVEATGGSDYITLAAPASVGAAVTYYFPASQGGSQTVLTNDGNGNLSWGSGSTNSVLSGITTVGGDFLDVNVNSDFSGITTFSNTTDNTLGDENTGAVQIDGGVGIAKNLTVKQNLHVGGYSEFVGVVTFKGGTINIGDDSGDNINVGGEFTSGLYPNATDTYDLGDSSRQWRNASFAGVGTFGTGANIDSVRIGIDASNKIDTSTGDLLLNANSGVVVVQNHLDVYGDIDCTGNVSIGGTAITLRGTDVYIENKDIVLGYTTTTNPNDTTANHAGVAIASTEGSPVANFNVSGINTLPATYKQLMWFKSGTLGFSTDAFAFNYGVAIGTTTMAEGLRLAVGSGITMTDTEISATTFRGSLVGNVVGNISSADQVKTVTASNTAGTYYVTFVDSHNGSATNETVYTDDGIYYNPGTNTFTTQHGYFTGNVTVDGTLTGTATTATRATQVDVTGVATNQNYNLLFSDGSGNSKDLGVDSELVYNPNTNTLTVANLTVNGNTTQVNTTTLTVEDNLIELAKVDGSAPSSDLNKDVGMLLHYYDSAARLGAVFWDDSVSRIVLASRVGESSGVLTVDSGYYAPVEIGALWVNDCAGQSQVISCTGTERFLENITVDGGQF